MVASAEGQTVDDAIENAIAGVHIKGWYVKLVPGHLRKRMILLSNACMLWHPGWLRMSVSEKLKPSYSSANVRCVPVQIWL